MKKLFSKRTATAFLALIMIVSMFTVNAFAASKCRYYHAWEHIGGGDVTCTSQGYNDYRCKKCGEKTRTYFGTVKGHKWNRIGGTDPTCTNRGYYIYKCSKCGAHKKDNYIKAMGHKWSKNGKHQKCTRCGKIK